MKLHFHLCPVADQRSRPARGGWIEIGAKGKAHEKRRVPPRKGWVD